MIYEVSCITFVVITVIWIIGLSGSGKSTLPVELVKKLKANHKNVVPLDAGHISYLHLNNIGYPKTDRAIQ